MNRIIMNASVPQGMVFATVDAMTGGSAAAQATVFEASAGDARVVDLHARAAGGLAKLFADHCSDGEVSVKARQKKTYSLAEIQVRLSVLAAKTGDGDIGQKFTSNLRDYGVNEAHHIKRAVHGVVLSSLVKDLEHHHPYSPKLERHLTSLAERWIQYGYDLVLDAVASRRVHRETRAVIKFVRQDGFIDKIHAQGILFDMVRRTTSVSRSPAAEAFVRQLTVNAGFRDAIPEIMRAMHMASARHVFEGQTVTNENMYLAMRQVEDGFAALLKKGPFFLFSRYGLAATTLTFPKWLAQMPAEAFFS